MLEHRHRALEVRAAEQHLAEEREAAATRAVDLDDAKQLALRFFPLMKRRVGPGEHHAAFETIGRVLESQVAHLDRIARPTEREIGLSQIDERGRMTDPGEPDRSAPRFLGL